MDWLRRAAAETPDAPAIVAGDAEIPYGALDRAADAVAGVVAASGIGPGGAVALWGLNTPGTVAAVWGIPRSGAMAVMLPPGLSAAEAMRLTRLSGATGLWGGGDGPDVDRLLSSPSATNRAPREGPPDGGARYVVFTSGSNGARQGVILTGRQIEASAWASAERLGSSASDRWLCVLPLGHVGGLSILWRQARVGGCVVLHEAFDAAAVADALDGGVTLASLVPTMLRRVVADAQRPFAGPRAVLVGGGPADADLLVAARTRGIPAVQTYGMTETASQVCTEDPADPGPPGTAGRPLVGVEVRTVDADGRPAAEGIVEVRGPMVSPGDIDGTAREPDGWLRTGDLGALDAAGRLRVLGRADRVIVTGGENVHPAVVEAALAGVPGVAAAQVTGEPDPEWGTAVVARIVAEHVDPAEVLDAVRSRLAPHEVPKRIEIVDRIDASWKDV
ncbi:MAG TPA: AMP-binding protein [Acidimicrobiia bacterium]|nr:AMP-binding protein [Acidimicrobiia bacterium]